MSPKVWTAFRCGMWCFLSDGKRFTAVALHVPQCGPRGQGLQIALAGSGDDHLLGTCLDVALGLGNTPRRARGPSPHGAPTGTELSGQSGKSTEGISFEAGFSQLYLGKPKTPPTCQTRCWMLQDHFNMWPGINTCMSSGCNVAYCQIVTPQKTSQNCSSLHQRDIIYELSASHRLPQQFLLHPPTAARLGRNGTSLEHPLPQSRRREALSASTKRPVDLG